MGVRIIVTGDFYMWNLKSTWTVGFGWRLRKFSWQQKTVVVVHRKFNTSDFTLRTSSTFWKHPSQIAWDLQRRRWPSLQWYPKVPVDYSSDTISTHPSLPHCIPKTLNLRDVWDSEKCCSFIWRACWKILLISKIPAEILQEKNHPNSLSPPTPKVYSTQHLVPN